MRINLNNILIALFLVYFIIINERKIIIDTGKSENFIEYKNELIRSRTIIESLSVQREMNNIKIDQYENAIKENHTVIDGLSYVQLDSLWTIIH